jgi:ketosteroid isomerase-like protein
MIFTRSGSVVSLCSRAGWLLAGALLCSQVQAAPEVTPETQRNKQTIGKAFAAWTAGGQTFFDDVLAPNVVWTIKGSGPSAGVYRGRQDLLERAVQPLSARLASPIRPTVRNLWAEGSHVIVEWDGETTTADGKPYRNSYVWILRMQGGRAVAVTAFLDLVAYDRVVRPGQ